MIPKSQDLLDWYDTHARDLPWRILPSARDVGELPDPYKIWLSEIMLQQTTVAAVKSYFEVFTSRWPTITDLAQAKDEDVMAAWAGLGYYARARNLLKCARQVVAESAGQFPKTRAELERLPGIGPYTSAAIASIAYDLSETVVDGNVERVMARVFDVHTPLPTAKPELTDLANALTPMARAGDYAQAVMDLGATICTPKSPACGICPWRTPCKARVAGSATDLPKKLPKTPKPIRYGIAYVAINVDGGVLLETRPEKGLLGGMLGWPGTDWSEEQPVPKPPLLADWTKSKIEVRHTFTHFHLRLLVMVAEQVTAAPSTGAFRPRDTFKPADLPTVMRKVWDAAVG